MRGSYEEHLKCLLESGMKNHIEILEHTCYRQCLML